MSKSSLESSKKDKMLDFKINKIQEVDNILTFTISNINVSYINAIRRVILANIPVLVFKSEPYEKNNINIISNNNNNNNSNNNTTNYEKNYSEKPLHNLNLDTNNLDELNSNLSQIMQELEKNQINQNTTNKNNMQQTPRKKSNNKKKGNKKK